MAFLKLLNKRLDYVKNYHDKSYEKYVLAIRRWIKNIGANVYIDELTKNMVYDYLKKRKQESPIMANKELVLMRATFNWGIKEKLVAINPTAKISFFPTEQKPKYIPPVIDFKKVVQVVNANTKDYLWTIFWTLARVNEVNSLKWKDVNLDKKYVILFTCKKKGGHRRPRKVEMTNHLYETLYARWLKRNTKIPYVFYNSITLTAYRYRSKIMRTACEKAGVTYFTFHNIRHCGASVMNQMGIDRKSIQLILGHEKLSTTDIYIHSLEECMAEVMYGFETKILNLQSNPQK